MKSHFLKLCKQLPFQNLSPSLTFTPKFDNPKNITFFDWVSRFVASGNREVIFNIHPLSLLSLRKHNSRHKRSDRKMKFFTVLENPTEIQKSLIIIIKLTVIINSFQIKYKFADLNPACTDTNPLISMMTSSEFNVKNIIWNTNFPRTFDIRIVTISGRIEPSEIHV